MFAIGALIAFIIALIVGSHDLHTPTFWLLLGLCFLAAHHVLVWAYGLRNGSRGGSILP